MLVSFFDILQLTNYLLYLNVQYQSILYNIIKLFDFANFEFIPNISNNNSNSPFKFRMEKIDTFIYSNLIQSVVIWVFSFLVYIISKLIVRKFIHSKNFLIEALRSYQTEYFFQVIVGLGFLTYCDLLLSVFLQFYDSANMTTSQLVGVISAIILLLGIIRLNILTLQSTRIQTYQLIYNDKIKSLYGYLYSGIEMNQKKAIMNLLFLFRKTIVIQQLVFNQSNPINQAYICCLCVGIEFTVMLILRPYKSQYEQRLHLASRFLMISSMILIIVLAINDSISNISSSIQNLISIFVAVQLLVIYFTQVCYLVFQLYQTLRRRYVLNDSKLV
ncbi:transmembrane protein, putative (macronuclear) [Tetrahymena thermophila SB210]|uniref:Transmembrane protein, putative n=1 Tax=Tetrahymena thermophila (strain SB210) TaxID=312017 RepID=W7XLL1_TETTS|nr:transmembrane protein, putative [Tetrahymena thermophila SB210]EWS76479.1 transmembrane protein, putative [Tetrahymena thermophila SB210]|eukprot:XP_012650979.1 transmembrane protein, putative [Tetrahymena thermophila SB210]